MIINKIDKGFQTRSDLPKTNWLGDEWYLVADNAPLAAKIITLYPRYDFVLDENDNLVDVVEIPKTDTELTQEKIDEIDAELAEIDSQGVTRHLENQIEASGTYATLYKSTKELIDRKNELRAEREKLKEELANC
jgi:hypothetical protein